MNKLWVLLLIFLFTGCMTPCKYCHETKEPDSERWKTVDLQNGYVQHTTTKSWIHYLRK